MKSTHTHQTILSAIYIHAFVRESALSLDFVFFRRNNHESAGEDPIDSESEKRKERTYIKRNAIHNSWDQR